MQIVPRPALSRELRAAGLDPLTRDFPEENPVHRLTIRECDPLPFTGGPHRRRIAFDGRIEGPFPVADRPALSAFLVTVFAALGSEEVLATIPEGTFWLNNRAQAAYLHKVPDAQRVARFLRQRGLTDRFRGGFRVRRERYAAVLPLLAANTFAGGSDVLFASLSPASLRLTALSCHHFDLHFASPDAALLERIAALAPQHGLETETFALPDLPEDASAWLPLFPE